MHASPRRTVQFLEGHRGRTDHHQKRQPDFRFGEKGEGLLAVSIPSVHISCLFPSLEGGELDLGGGVFRGFAAKKQRIRGGTGRLQGSGTVRALGSFLLVRDSESLEAEGLSLQGVVCMFSWRVRSF